MLSSSAKWRKLSNGKLTGGVLKQAGVLRYGILVDHLGYGPVEFSLSINIIRDKLLSALQCYHKKRNVDSCRFQKKIMLN